MEEPQLMTGASIERPASAADNLSDEQLENAIQAAMSGTPLQAQTEPQTPVEGQVAETALMDTPEPAGTGQVNEPAKEVQQLGSGEDTKTNVEPRPKTSFDQLQKETGVADADALATNYKELVRKMHQQAAEIKRMQATAPTSQPQVQPAVQPMPQEVPQPSQNDVNQWVLENFQKDPAGTIYALNQMYNAPLFESQRDATITKEIVRLSSSPTSRDFATDQMQSEMQQVMLERPDLYARNGHINPAMLETAYLVAKGRMASKQSVATPSVPVSKPVPVEGPNKQAPLPQAKQIKDLSLQEMEALIRRHMG